MHKTLIAPATVKAVKAEDGTATGIVEAIVSVFDNVDLVGDVVRKGAFADFVARVKAGWKAPFVWSHMTHSPEMFIGDTLDAEERDKGLWVKAQIHMDEPLAAKAFSLIEKEQVTQYSFAYDIDEASMVTEDGDSFYELRKLTVHETGPTMYGANPATRTEAVKQLITSGALTADEVREGLEKAGRVLSRKNEDTLRGAHEAIGTVLDQLDAGDDDGKAADAPPTKSTEDPNPGKADEAEDPDDGKADTTTNHEVDQEIDAIQAAHFEGVLEGASL